MNCPPDVENALLEILRIGLLQVRNSAWEGDPQRCAVEADHLHNLPQLLQQFSLETLRYYYEVERPAYIDQCPDAVHLFEPHWETLAEFLNHQPA